MTHKLTTVFFGTHEFAVTILDALNRASFVTVAHVITQPDRPVGRKRILQPSPVKVYAQHHELSILQPDTLKKFTFIEKEIDLAIVAQYGNIIPEPLLYFPKHNTLNVHTSLLPKYRGASPIQHSIMDGNTTTGTTIMCMDKGLDTGPILAQKAVAIDPDDTYATLSNTLADVSAELLLHTIPPYVAGTLAPVPQDSTKATLCKQLTRENGKVNWLNTAEQIYNQYRGLTPWPGIWTTWNDARIKLITVKPDQSTLSLAPGTVHIKDGILYIACKEGSITISSLQPEGKAVMTTHAFLQGNQNIDKTQFL